MSILRLALAQINPIMGDLAGNTNKITGYIASAKTQHADLIVFPELALTGYPPEDLLLRPSFIDACQQALENMLPYTRGITVLVGIPHRQGELYNACAVIDDGKLVSFYHKHFLPNYSVFDEERYFMAGQQTPVYRKRDVTFGVNICEDIWYPDGPSNVQVLMGGAELIINLSSSPFHLGKPESREQMLAVRASDVSVFLAFCNLVGGQDELVFDGHSCVLDPEGQVIARAKGFDEELLFCDIDTNRTFTRRLHDPRLRKEKSAHLARCETIEPMALREPHAIISSLLPNTLAGFAVTPEEDAWHALTLGLGDYVRKNGFKEVVLGLSGGVDSALTAALAAAALGPQAVHGVLMPSRFTSERSNSDALATAEALGIATMELPIDNLYQSYLTELATTFQEKAADITEENIQARIRGNLLMALSNKFGWLVLATGNKSELSTGYCTLYGDMSGGFSILKDVYKTLVWKLCRWWNEKCGREMIPNRVIDRPPTAELRPDQLDTDSLPPYEVLDTILKAHIENDMGAQEIINLGYEAEMVKRVLCLVDISEYKRRQGAPGIRITSRAFGKDRRMPITNRWKQA